ncbi:hypothetical protein TKK_0003976 [Trichogramma kaykai]|uniref:Transmembrane protein 256 homolog n=1 Tax=Trichogramma kaykai TaxID=54128 RepID=A0ABD2XQA5_9HYME
MGFQDALNYVLFTNPISSNTLHMGKSVTNGVIDYLGLRPKPVETVKILPPEPLWQMAHSTGPFIRIAALSGAAAVVLGAYGSHKTYKNENGHELRRVFETASRYHFIHTLAFIGMPMSRMPLVAGTFMTSGIILFCGTCYYYAFTGDKSYSKLTPIGGTCLIFGWLGMIL